MEADQYYRLNPDLRGYFESLPIAVKNRILESGAQISTLGELKQCAEHFRHDCGGEPPV